MSFQLNSPGDLTIASQGQNLNISSPNEGILVSARVTGLALAVQQVADWVGTVGNPLYHKIQLSEVICGGGSLGGWACQAVVNGSPRLGIPKPSQPPYAMNVVWDASGGAYTNATDYQDYSINQVIIHSENTGDPFLMQLRDQRMNLIGPDGVNSVVATIGTTHEMGLAIYACIWSQVAVELGYWGNLATYDVPDFWSFPNQTVDGFCAPYPLSQAVKPFMALNDLQNIYWDFTLRAIFGLQAGPFALQLAFSVLAIEERQNTTYDGQSLFTYFGNQICGPDVLGGCAQAKALGEAHVFYGYGSVSGGESIQEVINLDFDYTPGNNYANDEHNYCDCLRDGQPCPVFATNTTCNGYPCTFFPQVPRYVLAQYPQCNCPFGIC